VTGASAGLGAEFARQLAARGHDLLLVARREERLLRLAGELVAAHGVRADPISCDLADLAAPARLAEIVAARAPRLEVLVNNAGYGVPGGFLGHPWQTHADFQQVMVNAVAELCHRLLPDMQARRRGCIINVASLAGHVPGSAGHTLYAPSKAWLIKFTECLAAEARQHGVRMMALCPGFTYTEFHDVNGMRPLVSRLPRWLWMEASDVVRRGLAAAARGDTVYIPGVVNRSLALAARLLPGRLVRAAVAARERDFRRVD
jgi:short-subunit dehydrogenase